MRILLLAISLVLGACAAVGIGSNAISIETTNNQQTLAGASCTASNNNGSWSIVTPATVDVGSSNGDLRVVCNKSGYRTSEYVFRPMNASSSNVGVGMAGGSGGRVGVGLGFSVPLGGFGGSYPSRVALEMTSW